MSNSAIPGTPPGTPREPATFLPANWEALAPHIDALLDAPPERRHALLDTLSAGDAAKRVELERLILACEAGAPLLDRHAVERFDQLLGDAVEVPLTGTLGGRYRIERELGRGGMACVYLARDLKHARNVAVKVIRPDLAASLGRDRFLREIAIAARLRHPNIVPLYDSGDADGVLYFVMPFEEGQSLRERLKRDGTVPAPECVSVLRDVARALANAHEQGVVHRDIKPDNVLLSGGAAVVTDFGIAKAVSAARSETMAGTITQVGVTIGTPAYMAPEQAVGDPHADHRADIYSFGCLAYEMFTGTPPFHDLPTHLLIAAHVGTKPVPISDRCAGVPQPVAQLIAQCLEKRPVDRPQRAQELVDVLEGTTTTAPTITQRPRDRAWLVKTLAVVALLLVVAGATWFKGIGRPVAPVMLPELTISVLPLINKSGDTLQLRLAESLSDEIMNVLTRVPGVIVKSRLGVANYSGQRELVPAEVGRKLGVRFLVTGSLQEAGGRLLVLAQLIKAADGSLVWSDRLDRGANELGLIRDSIANAVGDTLLGLAGTRLPSQPRTRAAARVTNEEAFRLNSIAQNQLKLRARGYRSSFANFRRAIELDSMYADAYAGLSLAFALSPHLLPEASQNVKEDVTRNAERALRLDSTLAQPHVALGLLRWLTFDWEGSEVELKKAAQLRRPDDVEPLLQLGKSLTQIGRSTDAVAQLQLAKRTEPASAVVSSWLSLAYSLEGLQDSALLESDRAFESDSDNVTTLAMGSLVRYKAGQTATAHEYASRVTKRVPSPGGLFVLAATGDTATAYARLDDLRQRKYHALHTARAFILMGMRDTTRALDALEQASRAGEMWPLFASVYGVVFDSVRENARFRKLMRAAGLKVVPQPPPRRARSE